MSGAITPFQQKQKAFRKTLARMGPQIAMALPDHMSEKRMMRMCMTVVQQNPKLLECTRESLLGAIMTSAQLGLYPDVSVLGHAYFIPFGGKVVFVAGYKGLIDLAGRGGMVTSIQPYAVYAGDFFEFEYGLNPFLKHKPSGEPIEGRELTHVYCIARIRGEPVAQFIVMTKEEVDKIRARSPARNRGPWVDDYEPMAMKTSVRRLTKYLPISSEIQRATALDELADVGKDQGLEVVGESVIEGLLDEDEIVDAEIIEDEEEEEDGRTPSKLDEIADKNGDEPDEYTALWIKGNEIHGDKDWPVMVDGLFLGFGLEGKGIKQLKKGEQKKIITGMKKLIRKEG